MAETSRKLHIAMFPWLAFGHMIPFLDLAKLIAQKGHRISYISTPKNIARLPALPPNLTHLIHYISLPLPSVENLPQHAEATTDLPHTEVPHLKVAYDLLQQPVAQFLQNSRPDWIIYDFAPYWLPQAAADLGIGGAFFSIFNASFLCFFEPTSPDVIAAGKYNQNSSSETDNYTTPPKWVPFDSKITLRSYEAEKVVSVNTTTNISGVTDVFRLRTTILGSDIFTIRSCFEYEAKWLTLLGQIHAKPIIPVGLLPFAREVTENHNTTNNDSSSAWLEIQDWLNKHEKGSVVYIALGTEITPSHDDLNELAHGLELSGLPFFWVLRKKLHLNEDELYELPSGFETRVQDRAVIWSSWAPQMKILNHESVGGFLTHCGWGSLVEGMQFGKPFIMLPFMTDQCMNCRVMEEMKVGIEIARNETDGSFDKSAVAEALRSVMVEEEGRVYKENAEEMMNNVFGNKGLNDGYVDNFVQYLEQHKVA